MMMSIRTFVMILALPVLVSMYAFRNAPDSAANLEKGQAVQDSLSLRIMLPGAAAAQASLRSVSGAMIEFRTQNGQALQGEPPVVKTIPHLVLYRNGKLTSPEERTLVLELSDLDNELDELGMMLEIDTQHTDPDLGSGSRANLPVFRTGPILITSQDSPRMTSTAVVTHTFGAELASELGSIPTPTDYLRLRVLLIDDEHPVDNPISVYVEDYALLLENQWTQSLASLDEEADGAAPDELIIYYCDMFPFQKDPFDEGSRLARRFVTGYIRDELAPAMQDAVRMQTNDWGFAWHPAWTSYRGGDDSERISVTLTMPGVWFHGRAPGSAHSGISINTIGKDYADYRTLTDGMMSAFHHELFHNIQRNINLKFDGDGAIDGGQDAWAYFTEGMAIMASSVGQPAAEYLAAGAYMHQSNAFIAGDKFHSNSLNTPYNELDPYRAGLYWRFLYEVCGGAGEGSSPAAGMEIMRSTLQNLYSRSTQAGKSGASLVELLPEVMDNSLAGTPSCPFSTYRESIAHFARFIYMLRMHAEDCAGTKSMLGCSFYDPNDLYSEPPVDLIAFSGGESSYAGDLPGSYGIDFLEVDLDSSMPGQLSMVEFAKISETASVFDVQVLRVNRRGPGTVLVTQKTVGESTEEGAGFRVPLAQVYQEEGEALVLIITRVDADEVVDPAGEYSVALR